MRICQLQKKIKHLFVAIFLSSCASAPIDTFRDDRIIKPNWFNIPFRFAHLDSNEKMVAHPFFDIDPNLSKERVINFFVTNGKNSSFKYNFDLYSGKLYKERSYCEQDDIWDLYKDNLEKPSFTQGIVPRFYDQNKKPQRIIIFSKGDEVEKFSHSPTHFDQAKIVGSLLLEECDNFPCDLKTKWRPSQILVGVSNRDPEYSEINSLGELRSKVDWPYVKAMLANQDGVHQVGNNNFPAYRVSKEYNIEDTFKYFETNSKVVDLKEHFLARDKCHELYDDIWSKTLKIRSEKNDQQAKFLNFFKDFYKNKSDEFYQCQKFAHLANVNENERRLWFFSYLQAFTNLEKNGFYYSCSDKYWSYNPRLDGEHYSIDQNKELNRCRASSFEKAFDQSINGLTMMKNQINKMYRFIEYDTQHGGSHQKIYGWIEDNSKITNCKSKNARTHEIPTEIFPQDVVWQNFTADDSKSID